jgi:hypothetical protein
MLLLCHCAPLEATSQAAIDPALAPRGSAPALLSPWISFYASFDDGVTAALAGGAARPEQVHGATVLESGRFGRGIRLGEAAGGARIDYALEHNVDFERPGALSFWVAPLSWLDRAPRGDSGYVRFVRVVGATRAVFAIQRDARGEADALVIGVSNLRGGETYQLKRGAGRRWQKGEWHLVAVSWDPLGFAASIDGDPFVRVGVPDGRLPAGLGPGPGSVLVVGDPGREGSLLDELTVYTRPLAADEVARLWSRSGAEEAQ